MSRSSAEPLDRATRSQREQRFQHDFSRVSVHAHDGAATSVASLRAGVFTLGYNAGGGQSGFQPGLPGGRRLVSHEVADVVQQDATVTLSGREEGEPTPSAQRAARAAPSRCGGVVLLQRTAGNRAIAAWTERTAPVGLSARAGSVVGVEHVLRSTGRALDSDVRGFFASRLGYDFHQVRVHDDGEAARSAAALDAEAYTVGQDIVFGAGRYAPRSTDGSRLLGHELVHVMQQRGHSGIDVSRVRASDERAIAPRDDPLEQEADVIADSIAARHEEDPSLIRATSEASPQPLTYTITRLSRPRIQRQGGVGATRVAITRALGFLARRGKTISRHVARHTRHIAGRAVHSVFRTPNQVKKLVDRALSAPDNVLVQPGRRLRYVIEKQFGREIGKQGETIIHVVIEASGRIVTAYPVRAFTQAGAAAGVLVITLDAAAAEARGQLDAAEAEAQRRLEAAEPSFAEALFWDIVTFGLHGGSLNVGEDVYFWADRRVREIQQQACNEVISAVEADELRSLGPDERRNICDLVTVALAQPDLLVEESE